MDWNFRLPVFSVTLNLEPQLKVSGISFCVCVPVAYRVHYGEPTSRSLIKRLFAEHPKLLREIDSAPGPALDFR